MRLWSQCRNKLLQNLLQAFPETGSQWIKATHLEFAACFFDLSFLSQKNFKLPVWKSTLTKTWIPQQGTVVLWSPPLQAACKHVQLKCLFLPHDAGLDWVALQNLLESFCSENEPWLSCSLWDRVSCPPLVRHGLFLLPASRNKYVYFCVLPVSLHRFKRKAHPWKLQTSHVLSFPTKFSSFLIPWEAGGLG